MTPHDFLSDKPPRPPRPPSLKKYARTRARQAAEHLSDKMAEDVKSPERREMCESGESQTQSERERERKTIYGEITKPVNRSGLT